MSYHTSKVSVNSTGTLRQTHKVWAFFKGTITIKSLLMHPKDPIPDAKKTYIFYHWKCPAHNCIPEYIGETNRSLKEEFQTYKSNHQCHQKPTYLYNTPKRRTLRIHVEAWYSLEQYIGFEGRQAFIHYCGLHQV